MILIGSSAIKKLYPDFPRDPKDTDYAVDKIMQSSRETEYLYNPIIAGLGELNGDKLATLKASHLCWDINWNKHMFDLQFLLKKGHKIIPDLFWELYTFWNTEHGKNKRSDLKMSKDEFFTNAINYDVAEHDELHKIINPTPVYTLVLKDGAEVELDPTKFSALTQEQKFDFVREEVMVMAWERYRNRPYYLAYHRMMKKFIINHAPDFSLIFVLENYLQLIKPKFNYIKQINHGLQNAKQCA